MVPADGSVILTGKTTNYEDIAVIKKHNNKVHFYVTVSQNTRRK